MSFCITRQGIFDTVQDTGRYGYQHLGINPGGTMDRFSSRLANALLGKDLNAPVLELHFPAAQICFEKATVFTLCGADFAAEVNGQSIPMDQPVLVKENSVLKFSRCLKGARCYLATLQDAEWEIWLGSSSTHTRVRAGGYKGRALQSGDRIFYKPFRALSPLLKGKEMDVLPWRSHEAVVFKNEIEFIIGSEWHELTKESQQVFQQQWFQVGSESDRMGYRLAGQRLEVKEAGSLLSSAVNFGTVQLLPNGQLIVLMADHQTTGGYPRLAHVISAHLPVMAQKKPNDVIRFCLTDLATAERKLLRQEKYLKEIQNACTLRMENYLHDDRY